MTPRSHYSTQTPTGCPLLPCWRSIQHYPRRTESVASESLHQTYRCAEAFSKSNFTYIRAFTISNRLATAHKTWQCSGSCQIYVSNSRGEEKHKRKRSKTLKPRWQKPMCHEAHWKMLAHHNLLNKFVQDRQDYIRSVFFLIGKKISHLAFGNSIHSAVEPLPHWNNDPGWL